MISLFGKYLCYAVLALSVDLVWGYCGILSLGHGAFFALGGYAMGMYLMRQIGDRGVSTATLILPDFMVFLNWEELPWYWYGFDFFPFAMLMVVVAPGILAFVFGWFAFRSRVTGVYLSIITQAMTYALMLAFFQNDMGFGGNNGLTDFKDLLGFDLRSDGVRNWLFLSSAAVLAIGYIALPFGDGMSRMGKVLIAIRDAESRTRFLGYRVEYYKLFVFTLSAMLAGVAGALYVPQVGIINPGEFAPLISIEIVIWVALGGRGFLYGAIVGALVVNIAKSYFTVAFPEIWLFFLGGTVRAGDAVHAARHRRPCRGYAIRSGDGRRSGAVHGPARRSLWGAAMTNRRGVSRRMKRPKSRTDRCCIWTASPLASMGSRR